MKNYILGRSFIGQHRLQWQHSSSLRGTECRARRDGGTDRQGSESRFDEHQVDWNLCSFFYTKPPSLFQKGISHPSCLWSTGLSRRHQACGAFAETRVQSEEGENKRRMHSFSLCCRKWDKGGKETITTLLFMNLLRHFSYYLMPTALLRKPQ